MWQGGVLLSGAATALVLVAIGCGGDGSAEGETVAGEYWKGAQRKFCRALIPAPGDEKAAAGLVLQRQAVGSGQTLMVRVRNLGRSELRHGPRAIAYRKVDGEWEKQSPARPGEELLERTVAILVPRNTTGACNELSIPGFWEPGQYRVTLDLEAVDPDGEEIELRPWGYFRVAP